MGRRWSMWLPVLIALGMLLALLPRSGGANPAGAGGQANRVDDRQLRGAYAGIGVVPLGVAGCAYLELRRGLGPICLSPTPTPSSTPTPPTPTPTPTPPPGCDFYMGQPVPSAIIPDPVSVSIYVPGTPPGTNWMNYYIDGVYAASSGVTSHTQNIGTASAGTHSVTSTEYATGTVQVCTQTASNVTVVVPTATPTPSCATLTGSAAGIAGADTNPAHYGNYPVAGDGIGLLGGPLLDDATAASFVVATQHSSVETGSHGAANAAANNYFLGAVVGNSNCGGYINQLGNGSNGLYDAWVGSGWQAEIDRVDGACPLDQPTTAEVLQWAANKWGINPLLLYAEASQEGDWDETALGDWADGIGTSSGVLQVADRNTSSRPNHAWPGFAGTGANLSRENTCFNADFFAAHLYSAYHGLTGECSGGNIGTAIQTWLSGGTDCLAGGDTYTTQVYGHLSTKDWVQTFFAGVPVPY